MFNGGQWASWATPRRWDSSSQKHSFSDGEGMRVKRAKESERHWEKKRVGGMECSVCPRYTACLLVTGTVYVLFLPAGTIFFLWLKLKKNFFFFGNEFRGLIIHILYKRNPEDIIFFFFCQYKSLEILAWVWFWVFELKSAGSKQKVDEGSFEGTLERSISVLRLRVHKVRDWLFSCCFF